MPLLPSSHLNQSSAGSGELVVEASLDAIFDAPSTKAAQELSGLLVHLALEGAVPKHCLLDLITSSSEQLEDLRCVAMPLRGSAPSLPMMCAGSWR